MRGEYVLIMFLALIATDSAAVLQREKPISSWDLEPVYVPMDGSVNAPKVKYHCPHVSSCGWMIYNRWTRVTEWFLPNPECECAPDEECARREDNMSISAFVHYCEKRSPSTATTTTDSRI